MHSFITQSIPHPDFRDLGDDKKSDEDLLKSLEINPNESHVLNYLAYAWLERNYRIDDAIEMLERAYAQSKNDPYIIDSIGWAYYLTGDYVRAENLLRKAIELMPSDPIVNDHYGDILWKLDRKIQASILAAYFKETGSKGSQIYRIDAFDNVKIITDKDHATSDKGVYNVESGIVTLIGSVQINRGSNTLKGCSAEVNLNTGISKLNRCPKGVPRVRGSVMTKKK